MLTELAAGKPDVIVFELGDGMLGTYGVDAILECADIRAALTGVVLSANDPVAAWGGVKLLRERFDIEPCVVTGPSTDNQVGVEIIEEQMNVPAFNALSNGAALGDRVIEALGPARPPAAAVASDAPIPAVVLGGTGYVAGELLRLLHGASALHARGDDVRQPAGRAGREGLPAPGERLPAAALQLPGGSRRR